MTPVAMPPARKPPEERTRPVWQRRASPRRRAVPFSIKVAIGRSRRGRHRNDMGRQCLRPARQARDRCAKSSILTMARLSGVALAWRSKRVAIVSSERCAVFDRTMQSHDSLMHCYPHTSARYRRRVLRATGCRLGESPQGDITLTLRKGSAKISEP